MNLENTEKIDIEDKKEKEIGTVSKYICVVNKPMHFLVMILYTILFLYIAVHTAVTQLWYVYAGATATSVLTFWLLYKYSYLRRKQKGKLDIHKVSLVKRIAFVLGTILLMSIVSCIGGVVQVWFVVNSLN